MKHTKKLLVVAFMLLTFAGTAQIKPFVLKGNVTEKAKGVIYLQYQNGENKIVTDSAIIDNGAFIFKGSIDGVTEATIMAEIRRAAQDKSLQVFLSPGNQTLSIPFNEFTKGLLSGTAVAEEVKKLNALKAAIMPQYTKGIAAYNEANIALLTASRAKADEVTITKLKADLATRRSEVLPFYNQLQAKDIEFMDKYPNGYVTASLLKGNLKLADAPKRYLLLSPEVLNSSLGKALKKGIESTKLGTPGTVAPMFASKELRGEQLNLADYKGRYVLLDFWASWCKPCRAGNPHLLEVYAKYKDKGFEIIGVSDDDPAEAAWKKAIEDDKIGVWKHVLRGLKRLPGVGNYDRTNSIADKYGVGVLPTKILVDPKGMIVGRYTGEDDSMDKKLAEIFK